MLFTEKIEKAKEEIRMAISKYGLENMSVGCSFGKDSMVLLHLCREVEPDIEVFAVLANTEFQETYDFRDRIVKEWKLNYKEYPFSQVDSFKEDLSLCCGKPKVNAVKRAVKNHKAWFAGIRKTEGISRTDFQYVEEKDGLVKINPILEFTEMDVWRYIASFEIPINPKYKEGFRSLGCIYCSTPELKEGEDERCGRWRGTKKQGLECGIHTQSLR